MNLPAALAPMQRSVATVCPHRIAFYSRTGLHPVYVDLVTAAPGQSRKLRIEMGHGIFDTGTIYLVTTDGREGWGHCFAKRGHDNYVPDCPGHGRSPLQPPLDLLLMRQALLVLVRSFGPSIIFAHSAAGPMAWWMAEPGSDAIAAEVGLAAAPPANIQPLLPVDLKAVEALDSDNEAGSPVYAYPKRPVGVRTAFICKFWASSPWFPKDAVAEDAYPKSIVPKSSRILNARFNIGGAGLGLQRPNSVSRRPILIVTGELRSAPRLGGPRTAGRMAQGGLPLATRCWVHWQRAHADTGRQQRRNRHPHCSLARPPRLMKTNFVIENRINE